MPTPTPRVHQGALMLDLLIALALIMMGIIAAMPRISQYTSELAWSTDAGAMSTVTNAAKSYIRDNRNTLLTQVASAPVTLTLSQLQQGNYLPAGFSPYNTAHQTYQVGITHDPTSTSKLVAFVLTSGGNAFSFAGGREISAKTEGMGGYVWPDNVANGAYGGWQMNLGDYGLSATQGHLASWLSSDVLGTDAAASDRLYRYQVNGRPDLNRMHTDIDMDGNSLNNANTINAQTGNYSSAVTAGGDITSNNGNLITGDGHGWLNAAHNGGLYMSDDDWIRSINDKGIYTGGQLQGGTVRSNGRLSGGEYLQLDATATAGAGCSPNGLVSHDGTGAILSCQSGVWSKPQTDLQQNQCYQTGNSGGRNFSDFRCAVGYYAAGIEFDGHQDGESAYVIDCCH